MAVEPTNNGFPIRENAPDEALRDAHRGRDKGHGDHRSWSPAQTSKWQKKSHSHKHSRDRECSHDHERGENHAVTIMDSDSTRRPCEAAELGQDGSHEQRGGTPSLPADDEKQGQPVNSDMVIAMNAVVTCLMKQLIKENRRKYSQSSSSSSSSDLDSTSSSDLFHMLPWPLILHVTLILNFKGNILKLLCSGGSFTKMLAHFESKLPFCVSLHLELARSLFKVTGTVT